METRDKNGAQRAAEVGAGDAEKAIALNGKVADYYRVLGDIVRTGDSGQSSRGDP